MYIFKDGSNEWMALLRNIPSLSLLFALGTFCFYHQPKDDTKIYFIIAGVLILVAAVSGLIVSLNSFYEGFNKYFRDKTKIPHETAFYCDKKPIKGQIHFFTKIKLMFFPILEAILVISMGFSAILISIIIASTLTLLSYNGNTHNTQDQSLLEHKEK